jgi:hypothetical protein
MAEIEKVVPVLAVPLVAAALQSQPADRTALADRLSDLVAQLQARGAVLKLPPQGLTKTLDAGLRQLVGRGLVGADLRPKSDAASVLAFYAAPVWQRLEPAVAATRQT